MAAYTPANTRNDLKAFSGCDMTVHIAGKQCGTLQAITISITRETLPLYTMGNPDLRAVVRGKRGIAGSLVFTNFDRDALLRDHFAANDGHTFYGSRFGELANVASIFNSDAQFVGKNALANINGNFAADSLSSDFISSAVAQEVNDVYQMVRNRIVRYSDEIPEFDLCITMVNENGDAAWATVNGITLINQGYGYTMDDLSSETAYTFMARSVTPLTAIGTTETQVAFSAWKNAGTVALNGS